MDCRMSSNAIMHASSLLLIGRKITVGDGEEKAHRIGNCDANDGVDRIDGQGANRVRDWNHRNGCFHPIGSHANDAKKDRRVHKSRFPSREQRANCGPSPTIVRRGAGCSLVASCGGHFFLEHIVHGEAAARGVEVEQLGIAAPRDRRLYLPQRFFVAELLV